MQEVEFSGHFCNSMRRCPMSAQARSGKQRAAAHPRTMGGLRRRLLPRLFKFPARAAPVDHGFLAEVRVLLRWRCTGQGRRAKGCDDRRVRETTTARCSGKLFRYAPDVFDIFSLYRREIVTLLWLFDVYCASLCPHNRHRDSSAERCSYDDHQAGSMID